MNKMAELFSSTDDTTSTINVNLSTTIERLNWDDLNDSTLNVRNSLTGGDDMLPDLESTALNIQDTEVQKKRKNVGPRNVSEKRSGQALADANKKRGDNIIKLAKEFHKITDAPINVVIRPLTDRGKDRVFKSSNFESFVSKKTLKKTVERERGEDQDVTVAYALTNVEGAKTPSKKLGEKNVSKDVNKADICQKCEIIYNSDADIEKDSLWISCSMESCEWWVHSKCLNIYVPNDENGKKILNAMRSTIFCNEHMPAVSGVRESSSSDDADFEVIPTRGKKLKQMCKKAKKNKLSF